MRTKILLTILFFSQLLSLGLAIDYTVNPVNPAQGANTAAQAQPSNTGVCNNGFGWNGQVCVPCMQVKNGYCTCTKYGGCDTKVCDSSIPTCQVLTNGQNSYILLRATGCSTYAWGDSNTSVICTQCATGYFLVGMIQQDILILIIIITNKLFNVYLMNIQSWNMCSIKQLCLDELSNRYL